MIQDLIGVKKLPNQPYMLIRLGTLKIKISLKIITLIMIVGTFGVLLKLDLWTLPDQFNKTNVLSIPNRIMASVTNNRAPSSISSSEISKNIWSSVEDSVEYHVSTLDWDCSSNNQTIRVNKVGQLRLNGKCLKNAKRIVNSRNGYTANIFKLKDTTTTDYVSLDLGSNNLQFEWLDGASSNSSQTLEIIVEKQ